MKTGAQSGESGKRGNAGWLKPGYDPRRELARGKTGRKPGGIGEKPHREKLKAEARERVIDDLTAELMQHTGLAVDKLIKLVRNDDDPALQLKAAESLLDRVFGRAVSRTELNATVNNGPETVHRIGPEEALALARAYVLRQEAKLAADAVPMLPQATEAEQ